MSDARLTEARTALETAVKVGEKDHRAALRETAALLLALERGVREPDPAILNHKVDMLRGISDDASEPVDEYVDQALEHLDPYVDDVTAN